MLFHEIAPLVGNALPKNYIDFTRRVDGCPADNVDTNTPAPGIRQNFADGTIGMNSLETSQIQDFFRFCGSHVLIQTPDMPMQAITRDMYLNFIQ